MTDRYILIGQSAVPCEDLATWAQWFEDNRRDRHVADEKVGDVRVSTVFLGLDHSYGTGPPHIFETMVFGGELNGEMERYSTWDEAEAGHKAMLERVKG